MIAPFELFAPAARNLSDLVEEEVLSVGGEVDSVLPGGVAFRGNLETIYRFSLESRCASSLQLVLGKFPLEDADGLYEAVRSIDWPELFHEKRSFLVDAAGKRERAVEHTGYAARRVKDGIADAFREKGGSRPSVDTRRPDVTVTLFLERKRATIGMDLSGDPLHKRGYRIASGDSVLRETVAAALLKRAGWEEMARNGKPLFDPFCGSGTILIEAALMAGGIAPGLGRKRFGFHKLHIFNRELWEDVLHQTREKAGAGRKQIPLICGCDKDSGVIAMAEENIRAAGLEGIIDLSVADARFVPTPVETGGLIATDPPYGKRSTMGRRDLESLYRSFGENLKRNFGGWRSAILAGDDARECRTGLKAEKINTLWNGSVECSLSIAAINSGEKREAPDHPDHRGKEPAHGGTVTLSPGAEMAANRLKKNGRRLRKWLTREGVTCYRLYDADMPEYSAAVDIYESTEGSRWVHLQEYAPPASIDPASAARRLAELVDAVELVTEVPRQRIVVKQRNRQRGSQQYHRLGETGQRFEVFENGLRFLVNLQDFLDTGMFLDHRPVRLRIMEGSRGKRFLNLFAYTGTATVHAAAGGAAETVTVDNSNTYLKWFEENMRINGFSVGVGAGDGVGAGSHRKVKADCLVWLRQQAEETGTNRQRYDMIFLDPPTFSNSRDMEESFDVQRDHAGLIESAMALLSPSGELIFSTNRRGFSLELPEELQKQLLLEEITDTTIDPDYAERRKPHFCWSIRHRPFP